MLTAEGVWPHCRLEANLFLWVRQLGFVEEQHAIRIGFSVATATTTNKVVCFYSFLWSLSRSLCGDLAILPPM
jgi:hypothetical protein